MSLIRYFPQNTGKRRTGFVLWIGRTSIRRDRHDTWSRWTVTRHRNPVQEDD